MKIRFLLTLFIFALVCNAWAQNGQKRKLLFIGIDGVRSDALQKANTPTIDSLITTSVYTFDSWHLGITVSGPSWSSMMTGVSYKKHGVTNNSYTGSKFDQYPYFTTRAQELLPNRVFLQYLAPQQPLLKNSSSQRTTPKIHSAS